MRSVTLAAALLLSVACESKVDRYQRLERERNAAGDSALVAKIRWDSLKAAGAPLDSQTRALGDVIIADMHRKDRDVEMRLMMGGH